MVCFDHDGSTWLAHVQSGINFTDCLKRWVISECLELILSSFPGLQCRISLVNGLDPR